jgi:hemoglobin-like flavoprotein
LRPNPVSKRREFGMNQAQVELVQRTFAQASRIAPHLASTFYAELFAIEPSLKPMFKAMFKGDMIVQGQKLMTMLSHLVDHLAEPAVIEPAVREMALRHVGYGVETHHYAMVGTALLRTLQHELGRNFTPEARAAWGAAYRHLASVMREAAYRPSAERGV